MSANNSNVKKSSLYTRGGDKGETSMLSGQRRAKSDELFDVIGGFDELNSQIGLAYELLKENESKFKDSLSYLDIIMHKLFDIGGILAMPQDSETLYVLFVKENEKETTNPTVILEKWIDLLDSQLPELKNFILPAGSKASAQLHICRTVCRRIERILFTYYTKVLNETSTNPMSLAYRDQVDEICRFINRLSDFLFALARTANMVLHGTEKIYISSK